MTTPTRRAADELQAAVDVKGRAGPRGVCHLLCERLAGLTAGARTTAV